MGNFGLYLQDHRHRKGFTQRELAAHLEISPQYLCDIEKGNREPPRELLRAFATLLGLDRYEVFWMAGKVPGDLEELLLDIGPNGWCRLMDRYGR